MRPESKAANGLREGRVIIASWLLEIVAAFDEEEAPAISRPA